MKKPLLLLFCALTIQSSAQDMFELIYNFPDQLEYAIKRNYAFFLPQHTKKISSVICVGVGGSGCAHELAVALCTEDLAVPCVLCKSKTLPHWANEETLVIASSYSGNTAETLACVRQAKEKKCEIIGITSGGNLTQWLFENNYPSIFIPVGFPPRTALGYMAIASLRVLQHYRLVSSYEKELQDSVQLLRFLRTELTEKNPQNISYAYAQKLHNTSPLIYTDEAFQAIGSRMRSQLAENAKVTASTNYMPELFHNEIESLSPETKRPIFLITCNPDQEKIFEALSLPTTCLFPLGHTKAEQLFSALYVVDWISYWLAQENDVDPLAIPTIEHVKQIQKQEPITT